MKMNWKFLLKKSRFQLGMSIHICFLLIYFSRRGSTRNFSSQSTRTGIFSKKTAHFDIEQKLLRKKKKSFLIISQLLSMSWWLKLQRLDCERLNICNCLFMIKIRQFYVSQLLFKMPQIFSVKLFLMYFNL